MFHCYFVYTFCKDRINTFLILILLFKKNLVKKVHNNASKSDVP